ncbi:hypothetical protein OU995_07785 [Roseateles sp. SL47]|uniref:hypothetical protein n=1 Tax=Roseateles sp. SL47 TaxID=2995138 RepID=UPI00226E1850|nr:hypothetical protein [Roseateles sp. SL47]WAC74596.1 hypothetical protein OU995_07785 [Roseateles sp. SL47]
MMGPYEWNNGTVTAPRLTDPPWQVLESVRLFLCRRSFESSSDLWWNSPPSRAT